jgi:type IX secretion system PorP/SprF family membrane protein
MKKLILTYIVFLLWISAQAQDPQFTQFYANPLYLNPAFAGTSIQSRFVLATRVQWASIPGAFQTYSASYDQFFPRIKSGFGLNIYYDRAGTGGLSTTNANLAYAYEIKINRDLFIRPAAKIGYVFRSLDFNKLTFGDQLSTDNPISGEIISNQGIAFADFGTGVLLYAPDYWVGFAADHLNMPNESFLGEDSRIPIKYSLHGGYRFKLNGRNKLDRNYVYVAANYKSQGKFDQLDLGAYYEHNALTIGIWYRGLPVVFSEISGLQRDAVSILIGYKQTNLSFAYSYDITISSLGLNSGGSHELTVIYEWANRKNRRFTKRKRVVPCAKF